MVSSRSSSAASSRWCDGVVVSARSLFGVRLDLRDDRAVAPARAALDGLRGQHAHRGERSRMRVRRAGVVPAQPALGPAAPAAARGARSIIVLLGDHSVVACSGGARRRRTAGGERQQHSRDAQWRRRGPPSDRDSSASARIGVQLRSMPCGRRNVDTNWRSSAPAPRRVRGGCRRAGRRAPRASSRRAGSRRSRAACSGSAAFRPACRRSPRSWIVCTGRPMIADSIIALVLMPTTAAEWYIESK